MKYIDIHTHRKENSANVSIVNLLPEDVLNISVTGLYSTGLHPWYIDENRIEKDIQLVEEAASKENFIAVGETGLDKFAGSTIELQKEVFRKHIEISEKYKKPLIIHCVRMFNELIRIKKELSPESAWIIHGFNSNKQIAVELVKNGICLSFGKELLKENSKIVGILPEIPLNYIFFETDDSDIIIDNIYKSAAAILNIGVEELGEKIEDNFNKIF